MLDIKARSSRMLAQGIGYVSVMIMFHDYRCYMLVCIILLSACDFYGGVYRSYQLDKVPVPKCIMGALRQVEGVEHIQYSQNQKDKYPSGHNFIYETLGVEVELNIEKSDMPEYFHTYRLFNSVPSQDLIDKLRPIMASVDKALETNCNLKGLSQGIQERCPRGPFHDDNCK